MSRRRLRGKIVLLVVVVLALAIGVGRLTGPHGLTAGGVRTPPPPPGPSPTGALASELPGLVEDMGEDQYPNTFSGTVIASDDRFVIYTTSPNDRKFRAAVANLNTGHLPVYYVRAKFSYNQLQTVEGALANHLNQLTDDGVNPSSWGPDVPFDAVYITLVRPSNEDLLALSASGLVPVGLTPVTRSNYLAAATAAIRSVAGPNYKVEPTFGGPVIAV